jgi:hypothetical protein
VPICLHLARNREARLAQDAVARPVRVCTGGDRLPRRSDVVARTACFLSTIDGHCRDTGLDSYIDKMTVESLQSGSDRRTSGNGPTVRPRLRVPQALGLAERTQRVFNRACALRPGDSGTGEIPCGGKGRFTLGEQGPNPPENNRSLSLTPYRTPCLEGGRTVGLARSCYTSGPL